MATINNDVVQTQKKMRMWIRLTITATAMEKKKQANKMWVQKNEQR